MQMHAGIASGRPVPPPPGSGPCATPLGTWFEAPTPFGPMRLCAGAAEAPARHAADAAITLHECEALLAGLDASAGQALAWRWTPVAPAGQALAAQARAHWREPPCQLFAPWTWWRSLPAPAESWRRQLQWPQVPVVLSIARLRLSDADLAQLEPGGAIMLPASQQPAWQGLLRRADESMLGGVPVDLASPLAPALAPDGRLAGVLAAFGDAGVPCEVRLAIAPTMAGERLAGWSAEGLGPAGPAASLWRCPGEHGPARCLAEGALMPWGDGWAMALQTVTLEREDAEIV